MTPTISSNIKSVSHNNNNTYLTDERHALLVKLHANGRYWMSILDPNVYIPDPTNDTAANATYVRGKALDFYTERGEGHTGDCIGIAWPEFSI
jgi:alpha-glucosidase